MNLPDPHSFGFASGEAPILAADLSEALAFARRTIPALAEEASRIPELASGRVEHAGFDLISPSLRPPLTWEITLGGPSLLALGEERVRSGESVALAMGWDGGLFEPDWVPAHIVGKEAMLFYEWRRDGGACAHAPIDFLLVEAPGWTIPNSGEDALDRALDALDKEDLEPARRLLPDGGAVLVRAGGSASAHEAVETRARTKAFGAALCGWIDLATRFGAEGSAPMHLVRMDPFLVFAVQEEGTFSRLDYTRFGPETSGG